MKEPEILLNRYCKWIQLMDWFSYLVLSIKLYINKYFSLFFLDNEEYLILNKNPEQERGRSTISLWREQNKAWNGGDGNLSSYITKRSLVGNNMSKRKGFHCSFCSSYSCKLLLPLHCPCVLNWFSETLNTPLPPLSSLYIYEIDDLVLGKSVAFHS